MHAFVNLQICKSKWKISSLGFLKVCLNSEQYLLNAVLELELPMDFDKVSQKIRKKISVLHKKVRLLSHKYYKVESATVFGKIAIKSY